MMMDIYIYIAVCVSNVTVNIAYACDNMYTQYKPRRLYIVSMYKITRVIHPFTMPSPNKCNYKVHQVQIYIYSITIEVSEGFRDQMVNYNPIDTSRNKLEQFISYAEDLHLQIHV